MFYTAVGRRLMSKQKQHNPLGKVTHYVWVNDNNYLLKLVHSCLCFNTFILLVTVELKLHLHE